MTVPFDKPFKGKIVLLTGASSRVGKTLVGLLAKAGGTVYACDLEVSESSSQKIHPIEIDITNRNALKKTVDMIQATHGQIDYLFNFTGLSILGPASSLKPENWKEVLDRNILGTVAAIDLVYPAMVARRSGHIVNLSSITGDSGHAAASPHACAKAFIYGLQMSMQPEAARYQVHLSTVLPGYLQADLFQPCRVIDGYPDDLKQTASLSRRTPDVVSKHILNEVLAKKKKIFCGGRILWHVSHWFPFPLRVLQNHFVKPFLKNPTTP